jgi:hypothetical protein
MMHGVHRKMASSCAAGPTAGPWYWLQQGKDGGAGAQGPKGSHRQALGPAIACGSTSRKPHLQRH